ncbi:DUF2490 domain-containing protein [Psychroflexus lacisalsi]|jgi:hypothetical protein|uniref:DUF2490 domain-containing protein n=1 Tax=Psychroflexus lacisalsi TaxID=503928 RepID=A0ABP3VFF4_9FLAO|nr:DUF2490 domain-containing protein [Psychroflexus lacisalsi]MBZ9619534.1 DUF2490 domain-containing protein [Psychroflexus lacisalsi]
MKYLLVSLGLFLSFNAFTQVEESKLGSWYMYFYNVNFEESNFGVQGDFQYRNWNTIGDLEQLMLRSGVTYKADNSSVLFTLGYANITTGTPGERSSTINESRIYQEALFGQKILQRVHLTHRFRYEQRWVESQDFRTRFRYNLFINVGLNSKELLPKTFYTAFYNELFINGERDTGLGKVELFDRNRTYFGLGYIISNSSKVQLGWMRQETEVWTKNQLQFSFHHSLNF